MPRTEKDEIPEGARPVARVVLLDEGDRILLLQARHADLGHTFWITPGGGLKSAETFEDAAAREVREETGLEVTIGRWIWTRRHRFQWQGRALDQYERFFLCRTGESQITPIKADEYIIGHRWWALPEIRGSGESFSPQRLADLLPAVLRGTYPDPPIDCGI